MHHHLTQLYYAALIVGWALMMAILAAVCWFVTSIVFAATDKAS